MDAANRMWQPRAGEDNITCSTGVVGGPGGEKGNFRGVEVMQLSEDREQAPHPLIGRAAELETIRSLLADGAAGHGHTVVFVGGSGVGKSRLLRTARAEAERSGWSVVAGRAYPVESGIPYAPFADAFVPFLRSLPDEALATLTRGSEAELSHLFPGFRIPANDVRVTSAGSELRTRILWNFAQFLARTAARSPLLILLDDLQWADASSLELLHFIARRIGDERIAILCAYNDTFAGENPTLLEIERSLSAIGASRSHRVTPLTHAETASLVHELFGVDAGVSREFTALLFGWTRGNPFFIEETLKTLVERGRLTRREDGSWVGWQLEEIELPRSVRDAVLGRLGVLSADARRVADLVAVVGTSVPHESLKAVSGLEEERLVPAVEELIRHRLLTESPDDGIVYDFAHPIVREVLYGELGLARTQNLHGRVAESLETHYGRSAIRHAGELAFHYARAGVNDLAPKAIHYLRVAAREALGKYSNREAADYLGAALECAGGEDAAGADPGLIEDLARARQRLGDFDSAMALCGRLVEAARSEGDLAAVARLRRRMGLIDYRRGKHREALAHFEQGMDAARRSNDDAMLARLYIARGECLMELGESDAARAEIESALEIAKRRDWSELLARVHFVLLLLHTWTGPPERARDHGHRALSLAGELGDPALLCTVHWGLAVHAGLTGDAAAITHHNAEGARIAREIGSPLHRLRAAEPAIEFMSSTGEWADALELGDRAIAAARALNQRSFLARLLVWTALIHFGRGELELGRLQVEEAWNLSGAQRTDQPVDVHTVVPAHVGRAAYHLAAGDFAEAARIAESGLEIADRTGYTVWAIHRLLPILAEAYLSARDLDAAARVGQRLRLDSDRLGNQLGLAWADACDALLVWLRGDIEAGTRRLSTAANRLEEVPAIPDAARLRRHFAARLRDQGDREGAIRELRLIHEIFVGLGAERELAKTREQIRELGVRPPVREVGVGLGSLSARELEIARLVAEGRSNKAIAKALDISPRTVSTHLSNVFGKLGVGSRVALADHIRRAGPPARSG
jgi:DNA-binding CsgD family transcriptional regulator